MSDHEKQMMGEPLERSFTIQARAGDEDARTVDIAFSSEEPYERYFGIEVLSHNPQSVRLARLNGGAAVLVNHDSGDQVGVVESARIDGDGMGRAVIRFSKSARGQEIFQDVQDNIRQLVSVGYRVHKYEVEEREGQADLVTVTDWEPFELSLVAIPADATVGVGRSANTTETVVNTPLEAKTMDTPETVQKEEKPAAPAFDPAAERTKLRTEETTRRSTIDALADKYDVGELARTAITEGWDVPTFNEKALEVVGERNNKARSTTRHDGEVDLSNQDRKQFSLLRLMDAVSNPNDRAAQSRAGFELEVSAEAQRGFGSNFNCRGEFIPDSLLTGKRALDTTATDGAELVLTDLVGDNYIEVLRNSMVTAQAGMTILSGLVGDLAIPRQTSGASSTWISAEDGDATESEAQFDQVTLTPKDLACYTEVTRRLLMQSTPSVEGIVRRDLAISQAIGLDAAVLYGTGSSGQPTGVSVQTGVNTKDLAAADPTYAELIAMITLVMDDNALMGGASWIISPAGWEALSTTGKQASGVEGNFILSENGTIAGYPSQTSNQVTTEEYFFGDFSQVILGEWGGLELAVDPYTHSLKGRVRYVTFKTCDIAVRHAEAFCYAHDGIV